MTTAYFIGDSFNGTGIVSACATRRGWTATNDAVGGSGYCNPGSGTVYLSRLPALVTANPNVAVIEGGANDNSYGQTVFTDAVTKFYASLRVSLPNVQLYVVSTHRANAYTAAVLAAAATTARGVFIDWAPWLTGTGYVGATNGSGNSDVYIDADGIHPTNPVGGSYLGTRLAFAISAPATGLM